MKKLKEAIRKGRTLLETAATADYFVRMFKGLGQRVSSKELTAGARKHWYEPIDPNAPKVELGTIAKQLNKDGVKAKVSVVDLGSWKESSIQGADFSIEPQGRGFFLAMTKGRPRGADWKMGVDV